MNVSVPATLFDASARPQAPMPAGSASAAAILRAGATLADQLGRGQPVDAAALRAAMKAACGASDAAGAWTWKDAYESGEVALILFLRRYGAALRAAAA